MKVCAAHQAFHNTNNVAHRLSIKDVTTENRSRGLEENTSKSSWMSCSLFVKLGIDVRSCTTESATLVPYEKMNGKLEPRRFLIFPDLRM